MAKKRVWTAGCAVLILLLTCTVLSMRVEKMMRIEVETVTAVKEEQDSELAKIPISCYNEDKSSFFYAHERKGLFGAELVAVKKESYPIDEEEEMALIVYTEGFDSTGMKPLKIVSQSSWPLEEGDLLVLKEDREVDVVKQIQILACFTAILLPGILLIVRCVKRFSDLRDGNWKAGIESFIIIGIWLGSIFSLTGKLDIPREYLPPEYILDIGFYINEIQEFKLLEYYGRELLICIVCVGFIWFGSILAVFFCCTYRKSRKSK